jgi:carbon monoxide dehydrogenase subunit G
LDSEERNPATGEFMIVRILIVVVVLIAGVLVLAATKSDIVRIQRSIDIDASPEKILVLVNDFHNWSRWAPQDREDSTLKRTYSGAASGEGAASEWVGTGNTGRGRMSITKSTPTSVSIMVDWKKPFAAHNLNEFTLEPQGTTTNVTWTMQGTNVYVMKVMSIFMNMDRFMGRHFETGLANLKAVAENR